MERQEIQFQQTYEKWRKMLFNANYLLAGLTFVIEVLVYFLLSYCDLIFQPLPKYFFWYLLFPTCCNLLILTVGAFLHQRTPPDNPAINYIPVVQFSLFCLVISATHYVFRVTLGILAFPIFTTILFGERSMTRRITLLSLLELFITLLIRYFVTVSPELDIYFVPEGVVAAVIIVASNLIVEVLIRFQDEKSDILAAAKQRELEMLDQVRRDQKTGLYGPDAWSSALYKAWEEGASGSFHPQLLVLDIDDFKKINDTYGHAQGDKVILRLAGLINEEFAEDGFCARYGGEEFSVILRNQPLEWVLQRAESLRAAFFAQRYEFMNKGVSVSIGIAGWDPAGDCDSWFDRADSAMYRAKRCGKNQVAAQPPEHL